MRLLIYILLFLIVWVNGNEYSNSHYAFSSYSYDDYCAFNNRANKLSCGNPKPAGSEVYNNMLIKTVVFENMPASLGVLVRSTFLSGHYLAELETLHLVNISIRTIIPNFFRGMYSLRDLSLANNYLVNVTPGVFTPLLGQTLTKLDLSDNKIFSLNVDEFVINLENLEELILTGNPIGSIPAVISRLPNLMILDLSKTPMLTINHDPKTYNAHLKALKFDEMPKLQAIGDCAFCNFLDLKLVSFEGSTQLKVIHENAFGNVNPKKAFLGAVPKLEHLILIHCSLATIPEKLLDWNQVQSLYIDFNHFRCDCEMAWLINDLQNDTSLHNSKLLHTDLGLHTSDSLVCAEPSELLGRNMLNLNEMDYCNMTEIDTQGDAEALEIGEHSEASSGYGWLILAISIFLVLGIAAGSVVWLQKKGIIFKQRFNVENVNFSELKELDD